MNKSYKIGTFIFAACMVFAMILSGCNSGGTKPPKKDTSVDTLKDVGKVTQDIKQAEKIFNALPSPLESAMLIKSAGAPFDSKLLNPIGNASLYTTTSSQALNLGIFTCDLSFASLYDQTQLIINYMNAAKKMADGLGILDAIDQSTIDQLEENINNKEVIMDIISKTFLNSNSYLADNDQAAVASTVLLGGWVEGLYISTQLVNPKEFNGNKLVSTIVDQKLSIKILLNLLDGSKGNPAVDGYIVQMKQLNTIFDKITITAGPVKTEIDQATNVTVLKSKVTTDISLPVFQELTNKVAEIRGTFVK
jgi:hypothetical protein